LLAIVGFSMVLAFMALIMSNRLAPVIALVLVPLATALLIGTPLEDLGKMALDGIKTLAPTGVMLMFAILYFGVMIDAGLFEPVVRRIVRLVEGDPLKVVVGTAVLASIVSLDGDGSTTYMITVASMLPLYQRLGMNPLNLTCVTMLASGVMNLTPWGGPLARAASALHLSPDAIFLPMLPSMAAGIATVLAIAWFLGRQERGRLERLQANGWAASVEPEQDAADTSILRTADANGHKFSRPRLLPFNALLTLSLMVCLISGALPLPLLFMIGFTIAILVNYPRMTEQRERLVAHSGNAISVVAIIFAAGVFTGVLNGTGMVDAMSRAFIASVPESYGGQLAPITALASMPFTFFISNDAFYFGVLPIAAEAGTHYGVPPLELARASLVGQPFHLLSPLVPSTFLLVGLAGVGMGDHQRFTFKWAVLVCLVMGVVGMLTGSFSFAA
jgi:citrate-Mg2+:H+ or citrate-Ca2+:H+ symporter, CitMHS family